MPEHNDKFNSIMPQTTDKVLCIEVDRVISAEGYAENFLPRAKEMIARHGELRVLVNYKNFKGWEAEAAKMDMMAAANMGKHLKKAALVNPPKSEIFQRKMKDAIMSGEFKFFNEDEFDRALTWVSE